ncbi:MAG: hypothetical protein ACRDD7_16665 [Peptostreptococcaceae bacterium]
MAIVTVRIDKCKHDNIWYNYLIGLEVLVHDNMCVDGDYCLVSNMNLTLGKDDCTVVNEYLGSGQWREAIIE